MEQRLSGAEQSSFLVANDVTSNPGFPAKRGESVAVRRQFGSTGLTVSGETGSVWQQVQTSATGSPYRWSSVSVDHNFGPTSLSVGLGRLDERSSFLGGRREIDGELAYGVTSLGGRGWFGGNLFYRRDPGHIANSPADARAAVRFNLSF